jgi:hypothetical protein
MSSREKIEDAIIIIVAILALIFTWADTFGIINLLSPDKQDTISKISQSIIVSLLSFISIFLVFDRRGTFTKIDKKFQGIDELAKQIKSIGYYVSSISTDSVPFRSKVRGTDFEFLNLAKDAKKSIFAVGPNLNYLACEPKVKDLLFTKLKQPGFEVRFLLTDPESEEICEIMSKFALTDDFIPNLENAIETFKNWKHEAINHQPETLIFTPRKTDIVTINLLFIDGEDPDNARLQITPIPWKVAGGFRPAFLLFRSKHKEAYDQYWNRYDRLFNSPKLSRDIFHTSSK